MRRMFERVVVLRPVPVFDLANLFADGDHGVDEAVQLGQGFAFGRFHHQRAGHRKAQGGCMKTVIHQALGDVLCRHAAGFLQRAQVQDAFVCDMAVFTGVERRVMVLEAGADVVGAQNSHFGRLFQAFGAHHAAVHPADRQHRRIAHGRRRDGADAIDMNTGRGMAGQVGHQVRHHADRTHARPAAAVRNAEGLVQVEVAHVAAELARRRHADQRIHVCAVYIDTSAVGVHQLAEFLDLRFKYAVGARVGDHHAGELVTVLFALGFQVGHVHIALGVAGGDDHRHASHLGTGRVGAMGRRWNQADVAMTLAVGVKPGLDDQQPSVFTLRACVGLQADAGITGCLAQPVAQLPVEFGITAQLILGRKRMDICKLWPSDGNHLAGRIELHGAAAQRNHAAVQCQVLVAKHADIAQHPGFGMVRVKDRMRQEGAGPAQVRGNQRFDTLLESADDRNSLARLRKERPEQFDVAATGGLVQ